MEPPPKPADWRKPDKRYGGWFPGFRQGGAEWPTFPDLIFINDALLQEVRERSHRIQTPGYMMKVRESCPYACCQYLHLEQPLTGTPGDQKVIIKKIIRRRRPKPEGQAQEQAPAQSALQQQHEQLVQQQQAAAAEAARQQQEAEAQRQYQLQQQQQQQEAERQRQHEEEQQRQQQAAYEAEQERLRQEQYQQQLQQQQQAEEEERQRQAAAAAAAAAGQPAAPVQKVATFQNLGTDPAMAQAQLYYESTPWGNIGHGDPPVAVGTFPGHRWFIVANGVYAKLFTVSDDDQQLFTF